MSYWQIKANDVINILGFVWCGTSDISKNMNF